MARKTKLVTESVDSSKEKNPNIFQVLLLWIIIPLLFAAAVTLIIAKFADINVFDKAQQWSESIPFSKEKEEGAAGLENSASSDEKIVSLQANIKEKETELYSLQQKLAVSAEEKEALLIEQEKLQNEIAKLTRDKDITRRQFNEVVSTFENMSAKAAAPVITQMNDAEAIRILTSLKPDTLAPILEKMSPEDAAKYTTMMTDSAMAE